MDSFYLHHANPADSWAPWPSIYPHTYAAYKRQYPDHDHDHEEPTMPNASYRIAGVPADEYTPPDETPDAAPAPLRAWTEAARRDCPITSTKVLALDPELEPWGTYGMARTVEEKFALTDLMDEDDAVLVVWPGRVWTDAFRLTAGELERALTEAGARRPVRMARLDVELTEEESAHLVEMLRFATLPGSSYVRQEVTRKVTEASARAAR